MSFLFQNAGRKGITENKKQKKYVPLARALAILLGVRIPDVSVSHSDIVRTVKRREREKRFRSERNQTLFRKRKFLPVMSRPSHI
jgi:hypothetical protein